MLELGIPAEKRSLAEMLLKVAESSSKSAEIRSSLPTPLRLPPKKEPPLTKLRGWLYFHIFIFRQTRNILK